MPIQSTKFVIEKKVPVPSAPSRAVYPFAKMAIGDSFVVDALDLPKVRFAASWWKKRHPEFSYISRKIGNKGRIWRIDQISADLVSP